MTGELNKDNLIQNASAEEILKFLLASGSIDLGGVEDAMRKARRERILEAHPFAITQGKDGRWRTYIKDEMRPDKRRQIAKSSLEKLQDAICAAYGDEAAKEKRAKATLSSLYEDWIEYKKLHVASTTVERIQRDWNRYYKNSPIINKPIRSIKKLDLDIWVHEMIQKFSMTKHQYTNFSLIIRQMMEYALDLEIINKNPFREVKIDKRRVLQPEHKKPDATQVYTKQELQTLQEIAWKDFDTKHYSKHQLTPLAVMFMFLTGARVGEVCAIRYSDIEGNTLTIRRMVQHPEGIIVERTKGTFGDRTVPLIPKAMKLIDAAKKRQQEENAPDDGYVFSMDDEPLLYTSVTTAFVRYCRMMGIARKSSHKARKTFVSTLIDNGVNINTVRQIVGHTDERTTLNNYCYDRSTPGEKLKRIADAFS